MRKYLLLVLSAFVAITSAYAQQSKPIKGSWINLPYQDVRNKYMNPAHVNNTDPAFWHMKMKELSEMGLSYIVIMAVANEQKAFYPSRFMEPIYPKGQLSPVEAIMKAADEFGMNVFMSSGWAINQDDDLRRPEIRAIQQKIMEETTELFSHHKSFYGWYLPVEDSMDPILPDHAVDAVNTLTATVRKLTPNCKVMVSPYGMWRADMEDKRFAEQIKKLKVDIIAYQDEVGCVREPLPMKRMKENFKRLGEIHKETNIKFWSNVESFTWEKGVNSRVSALIPAAFPRYLSQIVGATMAGAEEVVSFSVYGMMDKPDSEMPIGQPMGAAKAYTDYMDWKAGKGRWPLLELTFSGNITNLAKGKTITFETKPSPKYNKGNVLDNIFGYEDFNGDEWLGFDGGKMSLIVDLKSSTTVNTLAARFMHYRPTAIILPETVDFYVSNDGKNYRKVKTAVMEASPNDLHDCWIDIALVDNMYEKARYIKVVADGRNDSWIFCDEILVNPK